MTTTPEIHDLTGAFVLDALDPQERSAFERHLPGCPHCRTEVAELSAVAAELGAAMYVTPTPAMKYRVLDSISMHRQPPPPTERIAPVTDTAILDPITYHTAHDGRWWRTRGAVGLAASLVAAIVLVGGLALAAREPDPSAAVAVDQVRRARDAVTRDGEVLARGGWATAVLSHNVGKIVVSASGLPALDDEHGYQLWLIPADGTPQSAGLMHTAGTRTELAADLPDDSTLAAITVEPSDGSPQPTTPIVVRIDLR